MNAVKRCRYGKMVYPANDIYIGRALDLYGEYSEAEAALFRQLVQPGQTVLDIGSNIGALTIPLAQQIGSGGRVLAFEPQRIPYYCLCANVVLNNLTHVVCHQAAVGEAAGTLAIPELDYQAEYNFGGIELTDDCSNCRNYSVPVVRIDDLPLDACHFMKIDVEGMEKQVLAGAADTIRRFQPLLYVEDDRAEKSTELRVFLAGLGYELYIHRPPLYNPQNFFQEARNIYGQIISVNLFCHPRGIAPPINPADFQMERISPETLRLDEVDPAQAGQNQSNAAGTNDPQPTSPRVEEAIAYNRQAINLAMQGRLEEAISYFNQALWLNPDYTEAHSNLGNVYYFQRNYEAAIACYERSLRLNPNFAVAHNNLGTALSCLGRYEAAATNCRKALSLQPDYAEAHNNLGIALKGQGQLDEAIVHYQEALRLRPNYAEAHNNLGLAFAERHDREAAVASYQEALRLKPDYAEAHYNLGLVLAESDRQDEAIACYRQALWLKPDHAESHYALGVALAAQGKPEEAARCYEQAVWYRPDYADAQFALGVAHLALGNFEQGWPGYEWRSLCQRQIPRWSFSHPPWDGSPLEGRSILLYTEQGLGDALQFIRYAPLVQQCGGRVTVWCPPEALSLLATCRGIDDLVTELSDWPNPHTSLLSLPGIFRTNLATIPAQVPYLGAEPQRVDHWRREIETLLPLSRPGAKGQRTLTVGIAWQGSPKHPHDRKRSIPLRHFSPLARLPGMRLISLQVGPGSEQLRDLAGDFPLLDLGSRFDTKSIMDAAAAVTTLDLVITVDSAIAHLAGALAVPVWVLLPFVPDWRWLLGREDSPWYPSMRLFRQNEPGNWDEVFEHVGRALTAAVVAR
jgi:FkbM family methyltransferase